MPLSEDGLMLKRVAMELLRLVAKDEGGVDPPPPPPPGEPTIKITPHAEGKLDGSPPQDFSYTVLATDLDQVRWAVFQVSESGAWSSTMGGFVSAKVPAGGLLPITARLLGDRDRLVVQSPDGKIEDVTEGVKFSKPIEPPPPPPPPSGDGPINVLVRGQSNALLFVDFGGVWVMRDRLKELIGRDVNIIASYGPSGDFTIFSGTGFLTAWMNGTQPVQLENSLLNVIKAKPNDVKSRYTIELWMHNESDQKDSWRFNAQDWLTSYEANKRLVEQAFGRTVTTVFAPVRYNYGDMSFILDGMKQAVARGTASGIAMQCYELAKMDYEPSRPNSEHMSGNDAKVVGRALGDELARYVKR